MAEAERQKRKGKKTSIEEIKSPFSTFRSLQKAEAKMWRRKKRGSMKKIGRSAFCFPLKAEAEGRKQKSENVKSLLRKFRISNSALHSLVSHRQLKMNPTEIDGAES